MYRDVIRWRTWFQTPMPNIGLLYARANPKTVKMFAVAWRDYQTITKDIKHNPGKDQNKVVNALYSAKSYDGLCKWKEVSL